MICPKCNTKLTKGFCMKCGYMENGNTITDKDENDSITDIEMFNKKYDIYYRNENWYYPIFFGPLYISFRGYPILGIILIFIDFLYLTFMCTLIPNFFWAITLIFINRVIYGTLSNVLCLFLDKKRIKFIKNHSKNNYKHKLNKHNNSILYVLFTLSIYILIIIIYRHINL